MQCDMELSKNNYSSAAAYGYPSDDMKSNHLSNMNNAVQQLLMASDTAAQIAVKTQNAANNAVEKAAKTGDIEDIRKAEKAIDEASKTIEETKRIAQELSSILNEVGKTMNTMSSTEEIKQKLWNEIIYNNDTMTHCPEAKDKIQSSYNIYLNLMKELTPNRQAYDEALLNLFYMTAMQRDIIDGKGEREIFYILVSLLYNNFPKETEVFIENFVTGPDACWLDVLKLYEQPDVDKKFKEFLFNLFARHLEAECYYYLTDVENWQPGLVCKWAPRESKHYDRDHFASMLASHLFHEEKNLIKRKVLYRNFLSTATNKTHLIEHLICQQKLSEIDFNAIPARADHRYRSFFNGTNKTWRRTYQQRPNDDDSYLHGKIGEADHQMLAEKYRTFLEESRKSAPPTPMEVYNVTSNLVGRHDDFYENLMSNIVKNFQKSFANIGITIPIINLLKNDFILNEGYSYNGLAVSLGYLLTQLPGVFTQKIIGFNESPQMIDLSKYNNASEKLAKMLNSCGVNTSLYSTMQLVLNYLIEENINPEDAKRINLFIFSTTRFDDIIKNQSIYEEIEEMFLGKNYQVPVIIYWNLLQDHDFPSPTSYKNVVQLSGYNLGLSKLFHQGDIEMMETCGNERYILSKQFEKYSAIGKKILQIRKNPNIN